MNSQPISKTIKELLACAVSLYGLFTSFDVLAAGVKHQVMIEGMKFSPEILEINAGDKIVWENKDYFPHNINSANGKIQSPELNTAQTWEFTPSKKGTYPYKCSLHPTMKATLIVK